MRQITFRLPSEPAIQAMLARDAARQQAQKTPPPEDDSDDEALSGFVPYRGHFQNNARTLN